MQCDRFGIRNEEDVNRVLVIGGVGWREEGAGREWVEGVAAESHTSQPFTT